MALAIAEKIGAEILSVDSRQIYRGLDIGTAKPTSEDRERVPHHFIDERKPDEPFSAGRFAELANARIASILSRNQLPLLVGGSTLYLDALVHGLGAVPRPSPTLRVELNRRVEAGELRELAAQLKSVDPLGARQLDMANPRRVVRALEVFLETGIPWSEWMQQTVSPFYSYHVVVLTRPREELYHRIETRVDAMLSAGLLEENRRVLAAGYRLDLGPLQTIGYQEPRAYLHGEIDYTQMVRLLKRNSRRYAKRQLTWYRRHPEYEWIDLSATPPHRVEERLVSLAESSRPPLNDEERLGVD